MRYWYKKSDIEYGPIRLEDLVKIIDINSEICDESKQWQKAYHFPDILSKLSNAPAAISSQQARTPPQIPQQDSQQKLDDNFYATNFATKRKSSMGYLWLLIVACICSLFFYFKQKYNSESIDYTVTSQQIYKEFQENEVAANEKYKGKRVQITGTIISFDRTFSVNYINIGSPGDFFGEVRAPINDEFARNSNNYKIGDQITIVGIFKEKDFTGMINLGGKPE